RPCIFAWRLRPMCCSPGFRLRRQATTSCVGWCARPAATTDTRENCRSRSARQPVSLTLCFSLAEDGLDETRERPGLCGHHPPRREQGPAVERRQQPGGEAGGG